MLKKVIIIIAVFATTNLFPELSELEELSPEQIFDGSFDDHYNDLKRQDCSPLPPAEEVLGLLVNLVDLPAILKNNFYLHTNPINTRSPLDLPSLELPFFQLPFVPCEGGFLTQVFFNQMRDCYFTKCSAQIGSYLNLTDDNVLDLIDVSDFVNLDVPSILPLFANIHLEERRAGFMFSGYRNFEHSWLSASIPFYWLEHNFFLSKQEAEKIQNQLLFLNAGAGTDQQGATAFAYKHLVSTKLGLGDLRLQATRTFNVRDFSTITLGAEVTLPTAHALSGRRARLWLGDTLLFGGCYCKKCPPPPLNFQELLCLYFGTPQQQQEAKNQLITFGTGVLDRLTANVADRSLGQEHTSIGPVFYYYGHLTEYFSIQANVSFDYFIPRPETRFFLFKKNPDSFNRDYTDPVLADQNLAFLTQELVNFFYPTAIDIRVHPGIVTKLDLALWYKSPWLHGMIGYDFWYKTREYFSPCATTALIFDLQQGLKPAALQSKIFAKLFAYLPCICNNLYLGVSGDVTVNRYGIGRDFTISIDALMKF